jgi:Tol biopolymer transport system component/DNA-binding winged helix-turn-helix (wHTH) protein
MVKEPQTSEFYDFGGFRLDLKKHRLWRGDELISLTPKEFELLLMLVENAGRVVEKDDLHQKIWKDTFVEDGTLTRNISWLRKKLGDGANGGEKFIETMPKRGYRFLPEVKKRLVPNALVVEEQTLTHIRVEETITLPEGIETEKRRRTVGKGGNFVLAPRRRVPVSVSLLLGIVAFAAIGFAVYQNYVQKPALRTVLASRIVPFTGSPGNENTPSFSPDGKQLAFSWNGGDGPQTDIYVRLVGGGEPVRLTDTDAVEQHPVFSPDGLQVAFVRAVKSHGEVLLVPALGGTERRVARLFSGFASVSFAPDGQTLAVIDTEDSTANKQYAVYLINLQTLERRRLTAPAEFRGETTPRFAPDGKNLTFVRVFDDKRQDLFIVPATGGEPRQLTYDQSIIHSVAWSADSGEIFFVSLRLNNHANLWRMPPSGGEPEIVSVGGRDITNISASPDGKTIAFVENTTLNLDIWQTAANGQAAKKLIGSTYNEFNPTVAPDGSKIVFTSNRTGKNELWIGNGAGKNLRQLTQTDSKVLSASFAPDGTHVAFDTAGNETSGISVISIEGGDAMRLTPDGTKNCCPTWSADGAWIYFISNRTGENQIWKMPSRGGEAVQITRHGAYLAFAAPDSVGIFYIKSFNAPELWRVSITGGDERVAAEFTAAGFAGIWTMTPSGIYFLTEKTKDVFKIKFFNFADQQIKDMPGDPTISKEIYNNPATNGDLFLYSRRNPNPSSIMLAQLEK